MTPVIFFTLEKNRGMEQEATRYGRVAFVPKLIDDGSNFDELERTIRSIVPVSHRERYTCTRIDRYDSGTISIMISVLYVDDEPALLEIGKLFLERNGQFCVDIITSAPAALTLLKTKTYDAIISDYQMPGMDGIEFLKKVRTSGNIIPFILFTGRGREEVVIHALNEGADYYLQKGGDSKSQFAELAHQIRQAVQQRCAEAELRAAHEHLTTAEEESAQPV